VAFILHDVFHHPFAEVAKIVGQAGLVRHSKRRGRPGTSRPWSISSTPTPR
jgi:hypothetical protein